MFSILIYIALPLIFLIHDIEEILTYKNWINNNYDKLVSKFPKMRSMLNHLHDISQKRFGIIVAEEFLIITASVICGIYGYLPLMIIMFWGFSIHIFIHIFQAIIVRGYVPGLLTSILFAVYAIIGIYDLTNQFTWYINLSYAIIGIAFSAINLFMMHVLMENVHAS